MIIAELSLYKNSLPFVNHSPFVVKQLPARRTTAAYWTDIFLAQADNDTSTIFINSAIERPAFTYTKTNSLSACEVLPSSFYWDNANQILYIHHTHSIFPTADIFSIGQSYLVNDREMIYIDDISCDPVLKSVPNISQKADLVKYDKLAFVSGSVVFDNTQGYFDQIITSNIYGNDLTIYYADSSETVTRDDMAPLANFYVEDYDFSKYDLTIKVQDKRKAQNARILSSSTYIEYVPLVYGKVRYCKAIPDEAEGVSGNVTYRVGVTMTDFGDCQVKIDDKWINRAFNTTDLVNGRFTLTAALGRQNGASDGAPLPCRLYNAIGIENDTVLDVIDDLNYRTLQVPYNSNFYNTEEWEAAAAILKTVGIVFDGNVELSEAIRILQNGNVAGFRYEIGADGRRTARVDDWNRVTTRLVPIATSEGVYITTETGAKIYATLPMNPIKSLCIKDNSSLKVSTDSKTFAASVKIKYAADYNENTYLSTTNTDFQETAFNEYRQNPQLDFETQLTTLTDAQARAAWSAERLSKIRGVLTCEILGQEYYDLRIYDMLDIDLSNDVREYFGRWKCQIIGINPKFDGLTNAISTVLTERIV